MTLLKKLLSLVKNRLFLYVAGILAGMTAGYLYYYFYGCTNGCPINSNPYMSMIWGGLMGYLTVSLFTSKE